jgi:hypothetical protein
MTGERQNTILYQFFAGQFHEDWRLDAAGQDEVVSTYIHDLGANAGEVLLELSKSIELFVAEHPDEKELSAALFDELGCYYVPSSDGLLTRSWLLSVAAKLAAAAQIRGQAGT